MIRLGGWVPLSSLDFPDRLAAVAFLQGCPWRCGYCHNPHLQPAPTRAAIPFAQWLAWLRRRQGLLDGVVFSGGEPTLQPRLGEAVAAVKALGFQVALHTGGMYPRRLAALLPALDWVGLDIKAPLHRHAAVTGVAGVAGGGAAAVARSLALLVAGTTPYECRTTWSPALYPEPELQALADGLAGAGVRHWALQQCRDAAGPTPPPRDLARLGAGFARFEYRPA